MVLSRTARAGLVIAAAAAAAGCGQSLFDSNGPRDGGPGGDGGDGAVPERCADPCLADAAADFNGSQNGAGGRWRYLEDARNRTWKPMTVASGALQGTDDQTNRFERCTSAGAACQALPEALLVSSAGAARPADPALEFKLGGTGGQVLQLVVRARVPDGAGPHKIWLYRNSREDVLAVDSAMPGQDFTSSAMVDGLPGDRFLVAVEPMSTPGTPIALNFFVRGPVGSFPFACQLAATFENTLVADVNTVEDLCATRDLTFRIGTMPGTPTMPTLVGVGGPYSEQGKFASIDTDSFFRTPDQPLLDRRGAITTQLWVRLNAPPQPPGYGTVLSDYDYDATGGGSRLAFYDPMSPKLEVSGAKTLEPVNTALATTDFPIGAWRFVRMVDAAGTIKVCVDGVRMMSIDVAAGRTDAPSPLHIGKNLDFEMNAEFSGAVDDLRVFSGALPCD